MRYKKGDKVRVKTLEKLVEQYGRDRDGDVDTKPCMNKDMIRLCGKVVTIARVNNSEMTYSVKGNDWDWNDKMFEGLAEDFCGIEIGDRITYENAPPFIYIGNGVNFDKVIKVEKPTKYEATYEKPILDKEEREYLSSVIRPFKERIEYVIKQSPYIEPKECNILIKVKNFYGICFPLFASNEMYKGMKINKKYTLKELGLE